MLSVPYGSLIEKVALCLSAPPFSNKYLISTKQQNVSPEIPGSNMFMLQAKSVLEQACFTKTHSQTSWSCLRILG